MNIEQLVADPRWLPHRLDWSNRRVKFVRTDERLLRSLSFIDGRDALTEQTPVSVALGDLVAAVPAGGTPLRMIFHVSFCGSTLLARLLDRPNQVLALKEPQCLVDVSDWRARLNAKGVDDPQFDRTLAALLSLLNRPWPGGETVVIKPSNWANNLIGKIAGQPCGATAVLVTIEQRRFLVALLRGGRDWLAFNARAIDHLASGDAFVRSLVQNALTHDADPLSAVIRLGALSHHVQLGLAGNAVRYDAVMPAIDLAEVEAAPDEAAKRAAAALDLSAPANLGGKVPEDAKNPGRSFSRERRKQIDTDIERLHGARIDAALRWLDQRLDQGRSEAC